MDYVQLKGVRDGIKVVISSTAKINEIEAELTEKLELAKDLLRVKSEPTVYVEGAALSHRDKCNVQNTIFNVLGKDLIVEFESKKVVINPASVFHTGTLRSGQNLQSDGHLVVFGDVNPGAEVVAAGNVVVLGSLRGLVHAGSNGDRSAIVAAMQMSPTQIRIADIITRSPDGNIVAVEPEFAYVKDERIYIDAIIKK